MNATQTPTHARSSSAEASAPGTPDYLRATATFNLATTLRPLSAAIALSSTDIQAIVTDAAAAGVPVVPIVTGHSSSMLPTITDAALVRVTLDVPIAVDADTRAVTIPSGARWGDVVHKAAQYDLAVPHGSSPDVGAVGYLLGGGLSFYGRDRGVAANSVVSITLVLADGLEHTVDADNDPELFWALRGGGGGFGIVTSLVIRAFAMQGVLTGMTAWDARDARGVAHAWRRWIKDAPHSVTTALRLMQLPDIPETPEPLRGRQILALDGAIEVPRTAEAEKAYEQLAAMLTPMLEVAAPILETWHVGPVTDLPATHADPRTPLPYVTDSLTIGDLSEEALDAWWNSAGPESGSELTVAELRQLGGAFASHPETGGAFSRIDGDALVFNLGVVPEAGDAVLRSRLIAVRSALTAYSTPYTAPTLVEDPAFPRRTFGPDVESRVEAVRRRVDPHRMFDLDTRRSL